MDEEKRGGELKLKHLGFVRAAALNTLVWLSSLYDSAKNNSGPLKPALLTVEGAVAPFFHKFKTVPPQLVSFLDLKVDEAGAKFEEHAPPVLKQVASQVYSIISKATEIGQELLHQAQVGGPSAVAGYAASESKEFVFTQTVKVWTKLDRLPPFHAMAEIAVPTAAHWSDRYNNVVTHMTHKGYTAFGYLPLIPVDGIAKEFRQAESNSGVAKEVAAAE